VLLHRYTSDGTEQNHLNFQYIYPTTKPKFDLGKSHLRRIIKTLPLLSELTDFLNNENYRKLVGSFCKIDMLYKPNAIMLPVA
jgi:hypothetical protein